MATEMLCNLRDVMLMRIAWIETHAGKESAEVKRKTSRQSGHIKAYGVNINTYHSGSADTEEETTPPVERMYRLCGSLRCECLRMRGSYARTTYALGYYHDYIG